MIDLLCSNYAPLKIAGTQDFNSVFFSELSKASSVKIASGYISNDAIAELMAFYNDPDFNVCLDLIVGMHYFEGFTITQYNSLLKLSDILTKRRLGSVNLSVVSKYHGKVYTFTNSKNEIKSIIGSSNISRICSPDRVYESDILIQDQVFSEKVIHFLMELKIKYCKSIQEISDIKIIENSKLFLNHSDVTSVTDSELSAYKQNEIDLSFEIPLKDTEKSNLNVYHGKGRQSPSGLIVPRNWYEVELIVNKEITALVGYPEKGKSFYVITDDGYKFQCKTSGDDSKNLRSSEDLKILGMWIKGRLEHNGCLEIGDRITKRTFEKYGRDTITLTKTNVTNTWTLDFGVKK